MNDSAKSQLIESTHWELEGESNAPNIIELNDVCVRFRSYHERTSSVKETALRILNRKPVVEFKTFEALSHVSLTVPQGIVLGVIGSNGSGKSTLLKTIAQVLAPTAGSVNVKGSVASLIELGVAFDPELSAVENIYLHASLHKKSRAEIRSRIEHILEFAELSEFGAKPIKYFSSGMVARLGFSCAIDVDPDILLVDEILGVGDERFQRKCTAVFERFFDSKKTVVIVGHNVDSLSSIASHIALMSEGKLVYVGDPTTAVEMYRDKSYKTFLKAQVLNESDRAEKRKIVVQNSAEAAAARFRLAGRPLKDYLINFVTEALPGWHNRRIAESFAKELGSAAKVSTEPNPSADINCYVDFRNFAGKTNCDVGIFTSPVTAAQDAGQFDRASRELDSCVALCERTAETLPRDKTEVLHVPPDVQFTHRKKLLGLVARNYVHGQGRFKLVDDLSEAIPELNISIASWDVQWENMPAFYEAIDYLLVLGEEEGGTIPIAEAIAMGVPVIAPANGIASEYTTLKYQNFEELKSLLQKVFLIGDVWFDASQKLVRIFEQSLALRSHEKTAVNK